MKTQSNAPVSVAADVKFHSDAPFTCVDVIFKSEEQIKNLIEALQRLLINKSPDEIIEIEDDESTGDEGLGAAIYLHGLGFKRDDVDLRCLSSAADLIMRFQDSE